MNPRDRERRFRAIKEIGCIACLRFGVWRVPEVHHLNLGGLAGHKRRGDEFTIGLCDYHHRGVKSALSGLCGPSLALTPNAFRAHFGSDDALLLEQNKLVAKTRVRLVGAA